MIRTPRKGGQKMKFKYNPLELYYKLLKKIDNILCGREGSAGIQIYHLLGESNYMLIMVSTHPLEGQGFPF